MPSAILIENNVTTIKISGKGNQWGNLNSQIASSVNPTVILDVSDFEPQGSEYEIILTDNIDNFSMISNGSYLYPIIITANSRITPIIVTLENIAIFEYVKDRGLIDIAKNNLDNMLILKGVDLVSNIGFYDNVTAIHVLEGTKLIINVLKNTEANVWNTKNGANIGGLSGETAGTIVIKGSGKLTINRRGTDDTGAGIGGGYQGGGGFIYIAEETNITFVNQGIGTPLGKDIGSGYDYSGANTCIFVTDMNFIQTGNVTDLITLNLKYGTECLKNTIFNKPFYLMKDGIFEIIGVEITPTKNGQVMFYSLYSGDYFFVSNNSDGNFSTEKIELPLIENTTLQFFCKNNCVNKCRGINIF